MSILHNAGDIGELAFGLDWQGILAGSERNFATCGDSGITSSWSFKASDTSSPFIMGPVSRSISASSSDVVPLCSPVRKRSATNFWNVEGGGVSSKAITLVSRRLCPFAMEPGKSCEFKIELLVPSTIADCMAPDGFSGADSSLLSKSMTSLGARNSCLDDVYAIAATSISSKVRSMTDSGVEVRLMVVREFHVIN